MYLNKDTQMTLSIDRINLTETYDVFKFTFIKN